MRILLVGPLNSDYGSKNLGGVSQHVTALYKNLSAVEDVDVVSTGKYNGKSFVEGESKIYGVDFSIKAFFKTLGGFPKILKTSRNLSLSKKGIAVLCYYYYRLASVQMEKYDRVHVHGMQGNLPLALVLNPPKSTKKILTVHSYHGILDQPNAREVLSEKYQFVFNGFDRVIHVSDTDYLKGVEMGFSYPLDTDFKSIHNGLDVDQYYLPLEGRGNELLFVGTLNERKRIEIVLESKRHVYQYALNVCGDGPLRGKVLEVTQTSDDVKYHGFLSGAAKEEVVKKSSCLIVPSTSESFGLVYIEALLSGLAVIGFGPVIREFIDTMSLTKEEERLLQPFEPDVSSSEKLSRLILEVNDYRNSKEGMIAMKSLQEKTKKAFGWPEIVKKVQTLYSNMRP